MATYCISDIHGNYERYLRMLEEIHFSGSDTLYVIGDILDRGKHPIKIVQHMVRYANIIPIAGNHEYMALVCLKFLMTEISNDSIDKIDEETIQAITEWQNVGGQSTIDEFHKLSGEEKQDIVEYLDEFSLYEEVSCGGKDFVLVHAGLDNFSEDRPLDDYGLHETVFYAPDYERIYF